jgi:hypothetical protein
MIKVRQPLQRVMIPVLDEIKELKSSYSDKSRGKREKIVLWMMLF